MHHAHHVVRHVCTACKYLFLEKLLNLTMAGTWRPKGSTYNNGGLQSASSPRVVVAPAWTIVKEFPKVRFLGVRCG